MVRPMGSPVLKRNALPNRKTTRRDLKTQTQGERSDFKMPRAVRFRPCDAAQCDILPRAELWGQGKGGRLPGTGGRGRPAGCRGVLGRRKRSVILPCGPTSLTRVQTRGTCDAQRERQLWTRGDDGVSSQARPPSPVGQSGGGRYRGG